jgi:hypothetical protein
MKGEAMNRFVPWPKDWFDKIFKRGLTYTPLMPTSAQKILTDWNAMQYGLRCHLAIGGYKFRPPGLSREELELHANGIVNLIANILVQMRAAEDVIHHYGLDAEYKMQTDRAQADVEKLMGPPPSQEETARLMAAIRAVRKAGKPSDLSKEEMASLVAMTRVVDGHAQVAEESNGHILGFPGSGGKGIGLGEERVQGDRGPSGG